MSEPADDGAGDVSTADTVWSSERGPDSAELIVLVHGAMDRSSSLVRLSRQLDQRYRVLRFDRRGYARSLDVGPPHTMAANVDDLLGLLAGRPALVVGHSYGGNVALAAAARSPLVRGVVTYECPLSWLDWWPGSSRHVDPAVPPARVAEGFMRRVIGRERWESLPPRVQEQRRAEGSTLVAELTDLLVAPWEPEQIAVPVVAMRGGRSAGHHQAGAEVVGELLGGRPVVTVAEAGHNGPTTHPEAVARTIVGLAAELDLRPPAVGG